MTQDRRLECELLRRCVKRDVEVGDSLEQQAAQLDWESLLTTADEHGVLPQLKSYVDRRLDPPETARSALQTRTRQNALHNLRLTDELREVLERFRCEGIDAIPFKGPALSESVYDGVGARQFVDLDVLVREDDALTAKRVLDAEGYEHEFDVRRSQEPAFVRKRHVFELWHPDRETKVELHWRLTPRNVPFSFEYERLWRDRRTRQFAGRDVAMLSPEDRLLYLCVHGSWHGWSTLQWITDVAAVVEEEDVDWRLVVARARDRGGERMLLLGLSLAHSLLGTPLPTQIESATGADPIPTLTDVVAENLFEGDLDRHAGDDIVDFRCRVCERRVDRLAYRLRLATMPMPADFERWRLSRRSAALYHVLRPLDLLRRTRGGHEDEDGVSEDT